MIKDLLAGSDFSAEIPMMRARSLARLEKAPGVGMTQHKRAKSDVILASPGLNSPILLVHNLTFPS